MYVSYVQTDERNLSPVQSPVHARQSFTAGVQPDGNVCRAELDDVEVVQARRAVAAGTKPF